MSTGDPTGAGMSDEELREAYEAQLKQLRVEHILLDNVVALINLGMRRTGLTPGTESERDPGQVQLAIEAVRALLPLIEEIAPGEIGQIRSAVSQLQLAYVRIGGQAPAGGSSPSAAPASQTPGAPGAPGAPAQQPQPEPKPGEPGPAQRSGRLWIPGQ
ncbi:MAG TPA: hypothetical protein VKT31_10440 [Solirubrobacteraceae bacterium]|nr:hypothetical protein [Solirubrobacteraceae bacterium]